MGRTCSELGIFIYWTCNSMNNLSSYCGLVYAKIRASDEDLPVIGSKNGNVILVSWGNDIMKLCF